MMKALKEPQISIQALNLVPTERILKCWNRSTVFQSNSQEPFNTDEELARLHYKLQLLEQSDRIKQAMFVQIALDMKMKLLKTFLMKKSLRTRFQV